MAGLCLKYKRFWLIFEITNFPAAFLTFDFLLNPFFMPFPMANESIFCLDLTHLFLGMLLESKFVSILNVP
jgi:hypothetical protein